MTEHTMELKYYTTKSLIFKKKKNTTEKPKSTRQTENKKGKVTDVILTHIK